MINKVKENIKYINKVLEDIKSIIKDYKELNSEDTTILLKDSNTSIKNVNTKLNEHLKNSKNILNETYKYKIVKQNM